jgi:hypothetical protein
MPDLQHQMIFFNHICSSDGFLFGLDTLGRVWKKPIYCPQDWEMEEMPKMDSDNHQFKIMSQKS